MFVDDRAKALPSPPRGAQALLLGTHALWVDGDRVASRNWFDAAYRSAESVGDVEAMAWSALGLSGLWLHEHRDTATAALVEARLRQALTGVAPGSSLGLRLSARLAGEVDFRAGEHAGIVAAAQDARRAGDSIALAEAVSMAHQCLPGPGRGELRRRLAGELIAESFQTGRRGDLLVGSLWRTADLFLDADPRAKRQLADLKSMLEQSDHLAVGFVTHAIEVMLSIRAGRLAQAEALADSCAERGRAACDADALAWHGMHMLAIRWYQGRVGELLPVLQEMVNSPTLSAVDDSHLAALAVAAATTGDRRQSVGALAKLRGRDLAGLPRSNSWLVTMFGVVEAAHLLHDGETSMVVYNMLRPFGQLPIMAGPAVACFGSAQHVLGVASLTMGDPAQAVTHFRAAVQENLRIAHRPAVALSRARLAQALDLRAGREGGAEAWRVQAVAVEEAAGLGMALPTYEWRPLRSKERRPVACRRRARRWVVESGDRSVLIDDSLGMAYLAVLLANPGCEIPAARLAAGPGLLSAAAADSAASSNQPVLDDTAMRAYRQRRAQMEADLEVYRVNNDTVGAARARAELDWLTAELKAASGLGGRPRPFSNSTELARISVGKAIRRALVRIATVDRAIGEELRDTVSTGVRCCYRPNPAH